jgi:hypothetical protein
VLGGRKCPELSLDVTLHWEYRWAPMSFLPPPGEYPVGDGHGREGMEAGPVTSARLGDNLGWRRLTSSQIGFVARRTLAQLQRLYPHATDDQLLQGMEELHPHRMTVAETGIVDRRDIGQVYRRLANIFDDKS